MLRWGAGRCLEQAGGVGRGSICRQGAFRDARRFRSCGCCVKRRPGKLPKYQENRRTRQTNRSELEDELARQLSAADIGFMVQYRFAAEHVGKGDGVRFRLQQAGLSDWRFDFAWPDVGLAVEVEGGAMVSGGHNRGLGFTKDLKKYHHAARLGWFVYRCDAHLIHAGLAVMFVRSYLDRQALELQDLDDLQVSWSQRAQVLSGGADQAEMRGADPGVVALYEHGAQCVRRWHCFFLELDAGLAVTRL